MQTCGDHSVRMVCFPDRGFNWSVNEFYGCLVSNCCSDRRIHLPLILLYWISNQCWFGQWQLVEWGQRCTASSLFTHIHETKSMPAHFKLLDQLSLTIQSTQISITINGWNLSITNNLFLKIKKPKLTWFQTLCCFKLGYVKATFPWDFHFAICQW